MITDMEMKSSIKYMESFQPNYKSVHHLFINQKEVVSMSFKLPAINNKHSLHDILRIIESVTRKWNIDNISRTNAYFHFFKRYPEVEWSFLASMVSRNAGYNMCDLEGVPLRDTLSSHYRNYLFLTYEKANYLIFKDVFPQLLLYHYSTILNKKMFHYLPHFFVTSFMEKEWECFWETGNCKRLMTALIINEQNVMQKPVIEDPFYQRKVFQSNLFILQDAFRMNAVLFPTTDGELYGLPVHQFRKLTERIKLGKELSNILFLPQLFPKFYQFASMTEHTGSRIDYEQYFPVQKRRDTPFLRTVYPIIRHSNVVPEQWDRYRRVNKMWFAPVKLRKEIFIAPFYNKKKRQLKRLSYLYRFVKEK